MAKNLSGKKEQVPFKLQWGTFCRQIVQDAGGQQDYSLIGVLNNLTLQIETSVIQDYYEIPIVLWAHADFKVIEATDKDRKFVISSKFSPPNRDGSLMKLEIVQKPGIEFIATNVQLMLNTTGNKLKVSEGKNLFELSFRHEAAHLGSLVLPITTTVKKIEEK